MANENFSLKLIFGLKIKELRSDKKLSVQDLAAKAGLSVSYLSEIEKGKKYPKGDKILSLATALDSTYDDLVSLKVSKNLQPVINLLQSNFFREFPLEMFGLDSQKLVDLIAVDPDKLNAFISTIISISRNYEMGREQFYHAALRSYQQLNDNYLEEVEEEVHNLQRAHPELSTIPVEQRSLRALLDNLKVKVDKTGLRKYPELVDLRSFYHPGTGTLYINDGLSEAQENFLLAREIGFQVMKLKKRPLETPPQQHYSFEELLNNHRASYFSAALLMEEQEVIKDARAFAKKRTWDAEVFLRYIDKYNSTPEMLTQRLTNILPRVFGIKSLFFLRFVSSESLKNIHLTKELHLAGMHSPHANGLNEHYCRRWVSLTIMDTMRQQLGVKKIIAQAQISKYHQSEFEYLCLSIAFPNVSNQSEIISLTVGFSIDKTFRNKIKFIDDPAITQRVVNTTCERCDITDCLERVAPPRVVYKQQQETAILQALDRLATQK